MYLNNLVVSLTRQMQVSFEFHLSFASIIEHHAG